MLQFLTDEQITPDVVVAAKVRCRELSAVSLLHWMDGHFVSASDEEVLREAARQGLTLVSFDLKTIPMLLRKWGERGIDHGGVIFVDVRSFAQNDIGGIAKALVDLWNHRGTQDWKNQCFFLTPKGQ